MARFLRILLKLAIVGGILAVVVKVLQNRSHPDPVVDRNAYNSWEPLTDTAPVAPSASSTAEEAKQAAVEQAEAVKEAAVEQAEAATTEAIATAEAAAKAAKKAPTKKAPAKKAAAKKAPAKKATTEKKAAAKKSTAKKAATPPTEPSSD